MVPCGKSRMTVKVRSSVRILEGVEHGNPVLDACSIYAFTDAEVFGKVPSFSPADGLDKASSCGSPDWVNPGMV